MSLLSLQMCKISGHEINLLDFFYDSERFSRIIWVELQSFVCLFVCLYLA